MSDFTCDGLYYMMCRIFLSLVKIKLATIIVSEINPSFLEATGSFL